MKSFNHFVVNDTNCPDIDSVLYEIGMQDDDIMYGGAAARFQEELNDVLNDHYSVEICGNSYDAAEIMTELYRDDLDGWYRMMLEEAQSNIKDWLEEMMDIDNDCDDFTDDIDVGFADFEVTACYEDDTPERETIPVFGYVAMHGCEVLLSGLFSDVTYDEILQIKHDFITGVLENHGLVAGNFYADKQEQVFNSLGYSFVIISDAVPIPKKKQDEEEA